MTLPICPPGTNRPAPDRRVRTQSVPPLALRPILRNVLSYEAHPRCDVLSDYFLARNVLSGGKRLQYDLRLLDDQKNNDNSVNIGAFQEHVGGTLWIVIVVDERV